MKRSVISRAAAILIAVAFVSGLLTAGLLFRNLSGGGGPPSRPNMAAIVDQLSLTFPNPAFVEAASNTLEDAGYAVDYYPGEQVTPDFYRDLPTYDYDLIVLRAHSARIKWNASPTTDDTALFTGEPYSETRHCQEEETVGLARARQYEGGPEHFAVMPDFITSSMRGRFNDTLIVLMGCDGLRSASMAEAFVQKGAKSFISWDESVSAAHTDAVTERLLEHLLIDKLTTPEAVARTMAEIGPDPTYGSRLLFYPWIWPTASGNAP